MRINLINVMPAGHLFHAWPGFICTIAIIYTYRAEGGDMVLQWVKCESNQWCNFLTVNLSHAHFTGLTGIYIIWHGGQNAWTVYVGQGVIADRIAAHRQEKEILQYSHLGLFVTWATVDAAYRDGVERFVAEKLQPRVGHQFPAASSVAVNLPW